MRSYKIYLYRHGLTQANLEGKYVGVTDVDLCPQGVQELLQLRKEFEYPAVGRVYSSPLKRCIQTAGLLYPGMTPVVTEDIQEYHFGIYENKSASELEQLPEFQQWLHSNMATAPEGGEDMEQFSARIRRGFDAIIKDMMKQKISQAAVITHGGVIMSIMSMCGLPKMAPTNWIVKNGQGYSLLVNAALWGNTMTFEICDRLPYGKDEVFDVRTYEMLDVDQLRSDYQSEQR